MKYKMLFLISMLIQTQYLDSKGLPPAIKLNVISPAIKGEIKPPPEPQEFWSEKKLMLLKLIKRRKNFIA